LQDVHTRTWHLPNLVLFLLAQAVRSYHSMHGVEKRLVYILRSIADPLRHYVGITNDMHGRLEWHNHGPCGHTTNHRPWTLVVSIEFPTERDAVRFEKYLKSGSGRAFTKRHFGPSAGTSKAARA
jgi:putative endonuclease